MHLQQDTLLQGGKYKIVRFISAGGFGCTYEGLHVLLKKRVAIKEFFVKDFCNRDEATAAVAIGITSKTALVNKLKDKFIEEAQSVSTLKHSHIVNVYDVFVENGTAYYVMDYIDGLSLSDIVKRDGAMSEKKAVKYILQVADALKYVHAHNRLHLDIKPANIMVNKDDNAILIDFGASKQYDEVEGENTSTLIGKTPGYAPLEQMGNDVVKFMPSTDIYALGATLYKILTGITPPSATLLASGEELDPIPCSVSENVCNAVYKSMQTNKKHRPQTVSEFVSIIEVKTSESVTPSEEFETDDETTQVFDQEKQKAEAMAAERERLLKDAFAKAEQEKAVAEELEKIKNERRAREEKARRQEIERKVERNQRIGISCLSVVFIIGCLYFLGVFIVDGGFGGSGGVDMMSQSSAQQSAQIQTSMPVNPMSGFENGHEWVDLGLPSGTKWATMNVGASSPSDYGSYFAWGETSPKSSYDFENLKYCLDNKGDKYLKYVTYSKFGTIDNKQELDLSDDAAYENWGSGWRLPSLKQQEELREMCKWEWITMGEHNGYNVIGPNGYSIFLPAAGFRGGSSYFDVGSECHYWSRLLGGSNDSAYCLSSVSSKIVREAYLRISGLSVRAVRSLE